MLEVGSQTIREYEVDDTTITKRHGRLRPVMGQRRQAGAAPAGKYKGFRLRKNVLNVRHIHILVSLT
jgi:hypothetical protein